MVAENKILTADQEAQLRQPIDETVGAIQAKINELRADGTDKVIDIQNSLDSLKRDKIYTAQAGGGAVKVTANGKHQLTSLTILPDAVDPQDVEMLQDLIVAAVNEAMRSADNDASSSMQKLTGGLGLPF